MEDGGRRQRRGGHGHCSTWRGLLALLHAPEGGARLQVGQKAGVDREGDEVCGEGRGSAFSTGYHEAPGGAGTALQPMASTEHVQEKLSQGFACRGLTALPGWESHVEEALLCSQAAPVHRQQLGMRWEEGAECAQDWGPLDGPWVLFSYSYVARRH